MIIIAMGGLMLLLILTSMITTKPSFARKHHQAAATTSNGGRDSNNATKQTAVTTPVGRFTVINFNLKTIVLLPFPFGYSSTTIQGFPCGYKNPRFDEQMGITKEQLINPDMWRADKQEIAANIATGSNVSLYWCGIEK